jgi:acyl carrier protein
MTPHSIRVAVLAALADLTRIPVEQITDAASMSDLGVDSFLALRLLLAIEDRVGVRLPDGSESQLIAARTVGALVEQFTFALAPCAPGA